MPRPSTSSRAVPELASSTGTYCADDERSFILGIELGGNPISSRRECEGLVQHLVSNLESVRATTEVILSALAEAGFQEVFFHEVVQLLQFTHTLGPFSGVSILIHRV
ncbi:hypothetical protein GE061_005623 [Apolygus lucorum]|uniref:Uncharacterized protein n=1 Tax=Apolygus lucorum TaxID=248454 RepID=A0A8S9WZF2_APOLU|nr:hypothetical protein GE061_005623 [Apolygus lucorum]